MARVLIVAKTRMGANYVCVGGLNIDTNESIRLLGPDGWNQPANTPYDVGQVWDIKYLKSQNCTPPHNEDVLVQTSGIIEQVMNIKETLMQKLQPWQGGNKQTL